MLFRSTASDVSGLPTSLKNPYALKFGSKTYDGSAAATITASDLGALTSITKPMVEGVLTGNITSHTHSYLPLSGGIIDGGKQQAPIILNSTGASIRIEFKKNNTTLGYFGFMEANKPLYISSTGAGLDLLHSGNYNSYTPTLTGTGASGTWGISISGNAATATKLQTPRTIWGQSFDGSANVSGGIKTCDYIKNNDKTGGFYVGSRKEGFGDTAGGLLLYVYGQRKMSFYTNGENRMEISTNGNILIGTTTDNGYKLDVNGKGHYSGDLIVDGEVSALVA